MLTQTPTKLNTYLVVVAAHELDEGEAHPVPAHTQVLEMSYPAGLKIDRSFLAKELRDWLTNGYHIQKFCQRGTDEEF